MDVPQEHWNRNNPARRNPISNDARAFSSCPNTTARYRLPQFLTSLRRRRAFSRNRITGLPALQTGPTTGTLEQGGSAFVTGQAGCVLVPASMPTWRTTAATWPCGLVVQTSRCPCRTGNVGRPGVRDAIGGQAEIGRPSWRLADRVRHREGRPRAQKGKDSRRARQIRNPVIEGLAESETETDPLPPVCHSPHLGTILQPHRLAIFRLQDPLSFPKPQGGHILRNRGAAPGAGARSFKRRGGAVAMTLPQFILAKHGPRTPQSAASTGFDAYRDPVCSGGVHG